MNDAEAFNRRGKELLDAEKFEKAIQYFSKALELNTEFADAYHNRGEAYTKLGRNGDARADLEQAIALRSQKPADDPKNNINLNDVDYLYDELATHGFAGMVVDNLYDEFYPGSSESQKSSSILEFLDGIKENVAQVALFQPTNNDISILGEDGNAERTLPLVKFKCIRTSSAPAGFPEETASSHVEIIETKDGNSYEEYVPVEQDNESGIFGFTTKEDTQCKYSFFPSSNIKHRFQKRFIGEILVEKGMITNPEFMRVLTELKQLKSLKIGQIVAKQAKIKNIIVERTIQQAYKQNIKNIKVGEILVKAGVVNEKQVSAALAVQETLRKKKIGQFLIEKGVLQEEQVYIALAEKFRTPYVDLRKEPLSKKVLQILPRELVLKFQILPLSYRNSSLVVATMVPDIPAMKDVISKHIKGQNIQFVLARPSQLRAAINQLYQKKTA